MVVVWFSVLKNIFMGLFVLLLRMTLDQNDFENNKFLPLFCFITP